jgi:hypothetical protein
MAQTITPVVHGGRRGSWSVSVALHAAGATASAAALGGALALAGRLIGAPWGPGGLAFVAAVAGLYALREIVALPVPIPDLRRQVPEWWRSWFGPRVASLLYGLGLGVGFATHLRHGTLVAVAAGALAFGDPLLGAAVVVPFGLARGVAILTAAGGRTSAGVRRVADRLERWAAGPAPRVANAVALLAVLAAAVVASTNAPVEGTSGLAPVALSAVMAWAAVAKAANADAWRAALAIHVRIRSMRTIVAAAVPAAEAGAAALLLLDPPAGGAVTLGLLGAFTTALIRARAVAGDRLPCGCFGRARTRDVRLSLARNAGLAALALLVLLAPSGPLPSPTLPRGGDLLPAALAALGVALIAVSALRIARLRSGAERSRYNEGP